MFITWMSSRHFLMMIATVAAGVVSCWLLVAGGDTVGISTGATLGTSSRPGLGASARLA
jgi:hypothetical protein